MINTQNRTLKSNYLLIKTKTKTNFFFFFNTRCRYCILSALDLCAKPRKFQNIIFSPWGRGNI